MKAKAHSRLATFCGLNCSKISMDFMLIASNNGPSFSEKFASAQAMLASACGKNSGILERAKELMAPKSASFLHNSRPLFSYYLYLLLLFFPCSIYLSM